jgi:hypothetical protein
MVNRHKKQAKVRLKTMNRVLPFLKMVHHVDTQGTDAIIRSSHFYIHRRWTVGVLANDGVYFVTPDMQVFNSSLQFGLVFNDCFF